MKRCPRGSRLVIVASRVGLSLLGSGGCRFWPRRADRIDPVISRAEACSSERRRLATGVLSRAVGTGDKGVGIRRPGPAAAPVHHHVAFGLQPGDHPAHRAFADVGLADDRRRRRPAPGAVVARARVGQCQQHRRSLPEVGELAQTQFMTAMLILPASPRGRGRRRCARQRQERHPLHTAATAGCPILGAEWERQASVRCPQARPAGPVRGG
jgi:hypothetical protein